MLSALTVSVHIYNKFQLVIFFGLFMFVQNKLVGKLAKFNRSKKTNGQKQFSKHNILNTNEL